MTRDRNQHRDDVAGDDGSGWLGRCLAEEDEFDRRTLWRLASWGVGSVGMLVVAILASQSPAAMRRDQQAAAEIARQSQQVQWIAKESQAKARELAAAVETLNGDRDRLYARVTHLEQGLDSVTGALARPAAPASFLSASTAAAIPFADATLIGPVPPPDTKAEIALPKIASVATTTPAMAPATAKPADSQLSDHQAATVPTSSAKADAATTTAALATTAPAAGEPAAGSEVARTEFGVDLGGANSLEGLRGLWRGAIKAHSEQLSSLQPRILIRERRDGWGMQLRLLAGPLSDAATAARICAALTESSRSCETAVFEGQRLTLQSENKSQTKPTGAKNPEASARPAKRRAKPPPEPVQAKPKTSSLGSFFSSR
jgi:hypothetical protein